MRLDSYKLRHRKLSSYCNFLPLDPEILMEIIVVQRVSPLCVASPGWNSFLATHTALFVLPSLTLVHKLGESCFPHDWRQTPGCNQAGSNSLPSSSLWTHLMTIQTVQ